MLVDLVLSRTTKIALVVLIVVIGALLAFDLLFGSGSSAGKLTPAGPGASAPLLKRRDHGGGPNHTSAGAETLRQRSLR